MEEQYVSATVIHISLETYMSETEIYNTSVSVAYKLSDITSMMIEGYGLAENNGARGKEKSKNDNNTVVKRQGKIR